MNFKRWVCAALVGGIIGWGMLPQNVAANGQKPAATATPIGHVVVIFQENNSFDHYFATYPYAANPKGEMPFVAAPGTPTVNGLIGPLLSANPNVIAVNAADQPIAPMPLNPFRLDP